ncbi:hypothetical protein JYK02_35025 [Corallococcus macrosporus]|uniref:Lipoprotein n=1 Tax=Corallococcus macrosporus TaxID=35 RepID=A0ABS3DN51_9BACT|nr:hypothetical protein [Corallococcus macrosporus]MBN8232744.1 hypothetical protein [Corallococcus macrosporus]
MSRLAALVILLLVCACAGGPPSRNTVNLNDPSLRRGEALLRHGAGSAELSPMDPVPSVQELGAQAGFGRAWKARSVRASVYLFDSYTEASAAEDTLRARVPEGLRGSGTVNGNLLVWATADATDEAGQAIINDVLSAFAGEE